MRNAPRSSAPSIQQFRIYSLDTNTKTKGLPHRRGRMPRHYYGKRAFMKSMPGRLAPRRSVKGIEQRIMRGSILSIGTSPAARGFALTPIRRNPNDGARHAIPQDDDAAVDGAGGDLRYCCRGTYRATAIVLP